MLFLFGFLISFSSVVSVRLQCYFKYRFGDYQPPSETKTCPSGSVCYTLSYVAHPDDGSQTDVLFSNCILGLRCNEDAICRSLEGQRSVTNCRVTCCRTNLCNNGAATGKQGDMHLSHK